LEKKTARQLRRESGCLISPPAFVGGGGTGSCRLFHAGRRVKKTENPAGIGAT
jgi:hypothetical protein